MIASRLLRIRQHLFWIAPIPVVAWLYHKIVDSAGISLKKYFSNLQTSCELTNDSNEEKNLYLSREIVDRLFADVEKYYEQCIKKHIKEPSNHSNEHPINTLKDMFIDAYQTIIYPFTELEGVKHSQMDDYIKSAQLALSQKAYDPIFFRSPMNVDKLLLVKEGKLQEYQLEELMTHLLENVLRVNTDLNDCSRLLAEQTLLLLAETENLYDMFFHSDYSRHFRDRNRTRRYLKLYLQAILENLQSNRERTCCLLENGLLILLHKLHKCYPELQVDKWLSMCLSALSVYDESHEHLFNTGWISVLAEWLHSKDLRIHLEARRALNNIVNKHNVLRKSLFLLHDSFNPEFDVVFIHGLRGGVLRTWRQLDSARNDPSQNYSECWPKSWLAEEFPNSRILAVNYQTFLSNWNGAYCDDSYTLKGRSDQLYDDLKTAGLGQRPIVWIAHSMGGLLLKQMLTDENSQDDYASCFTENTAGIVFFSVPNRGSEMAVWSSHIQRIISPSDHVMELRKDSPELKSLHRKFVNLYNRSNFELLSFGETQKCCILKNPIEYWTLLVDEESSNPGIGTFKLLNENHFDICKPYSKDSQSYLALRQFICDIVGRNCVEKQLRKDMISNLF